MMAKKPRGNRSGRNPEEKRKQAVSGQEGISADLPVESPPEPEGSELPLEDPRADQEFPEFEEEPSSVSHPAPPVRRGLLRRRWVQVLLALAALAILALGILAWMVGGEALRYRREILALRDGKPTAISRLFHSRIYSDSYPILEGTVASLSRLVAELEARGYEETDEDEPAPGQYHQMGGRIVVHLRGFSLAGLSGPRATVRVSFQGDKIQSVQFLDGSSEAKAAVPAVEPVLLTEALGNPPRRCTLVPLSRIPDHLRNAAIASEDLRFYSHYGFDLRGILRAASRNLAAGEVEQGGSTITQQLARTLFLNTAKHFRRKLNELAAAVLLDWYLPKDAQLELYLNTVYLGQQGGVSLHGVEEASRAYFGKAVEDLDEAEAATIVGIIPAPNAFAPSVSLSKALERRNHVLDLMAANGFLTKAEVRKAREEALAPHSSPSREMLWPHYTGYVREWLRRRFGAGWDLMGLTVVTHLDPVLQDRAQEAVAREVGRFGNSFGSQGGELQGAAFFMEPSSGQVLAVVGGRESEAGGLNRAFQSHRQPGSAFKPVVYATALEGGEGIPPFTPGTTLSDERRTFRVPEGEWSPKNYEGVYHPMVSLAKALTKSLNVATANLVEKVGPRRVAGMAEAMGLGKLKPVMSIGLGSNEVTLETLTSAFSSFSAGGVRVDPCPVRMVRDAWGREAFRPTVPAQRIFSRKTADLMVEMLRNVTIYGTAARLRSMNYYPSPCAGKTGTSQGERDVWFVGFTPSVALGIWVGYDRPTHMPGSATDIAVPVWGGVMTDLTREMPHPDFILSPSLEYAWIDPYTGKRAGGSCPSTMRVAFLKGTVPKETCMGPHFYTGEGEEEEGETGEEEILGPDGTPLPTPDGNSPELPPPPPPPGQ